MPCGIEDWGCGGVTGGVCALGAGLEASGATVLAASCGVAARLGLGVAEGSARGLRGGLPGGVAADLAEGLTEPDAFMAAMGVIGVGPGETCRNARMTTSWFCWSPCSEIDCRYQACDF